jgi:hypothetical protein
MPGRPDRGDLDAPSFHTAASLSWLWFAHGHLFREAGVDGGVNPRKSGAGQKVGTEIAVELFKANGLGD